MGTLWKLPPPPPLSLESFDEGLNDEGVARTGEGVHAHPPTTEAYAVVVQTSPLRSGIGLKFWISSFRIAS